MNLHEKCLLKYLKNPDELSYSTDVLKLNNFNTSVEYESSSDDVLKLNNFILEKHFLMQNFIAKSSLFHYTEK